MQTILTIKDSDIFPGATDNNPEEFSLREAARAILINEAGKVALLHVAKWSYYKLPGGGVEAGEDMKLALARELREEIGSEAEIIDEVGEIIELKNDHKAKQISHCWFARQVGESTPPAFTEEELQDGFEVMWAVDIQHAITLLERCEPSNYTGHFIKRRDVEFLKFAKASL